MCSGEQVWYKPNCIAVDTVTIPQVCNLVLSGWCRQRLAVYCLQQTLQRVGWTSQLWTGWCRLTVPRMCPATSTEWAGQPDTLQVALCPVKVSCPYSLSHLAHCDIRVTPLVEALHLESVKTEQKADQRAVSQLLQSTNLSLCHCQPWLCCCSVADEAGLCKEHAQQLQQHCTVCTTPSQPSKRSCALLMLVESCRKLAAACDQYQSAVAMPKPFN